MKPLLDSGKPLLYMKGRLPQSLTEIKQKLKPLPENPRIERNGDFFLQ